MKKCIAFGLLFVLLLSFAACGTKEGVVSMDSPSSLAGAESIQAAAGSVRIKITAGDSVVYGTLYDNEVAASYAAMLTLTLNAFDRIGLVKSTVLPRALSGKGQMTRSYVKGAIFYWPAGPEVAFCYSDHLPETVVDIIHIGMIDDGVEVFETYEGTILIERYVEPEA